MMLTCPLSAILHALSGNRDGGVPGAAEGKLEGQQRGRAVSPATGLQLGPQQQQPELQRKQ